MTHNLGSISFLVGNLYTFFLDARLRAIPLPVRLVGCALAIFLYLVIFHRRQAQPVPVAFAQPVFGAGMFPVPNHGQVYYGPAAPTYVAPVPPVAPAVEPSLTGGVVTSEMKFINQFLHERGIVVQTLNVVDSPDYSVYDLVKLAGTSWSILTKQVLEDLGAEIHVWRGGGQQVTVTFNAQPAYLRVTKRERGQLPWAARQPGLRPYVAQIGAALDGRQLRLVTVDFADDDEWSLAAFSSPGGGKSNILKSVALSVLENADPQITEAYFVDLDSNQYDGLLRLPHVKYVARTEEEAYGLLRYLASLIEANRDLSNQVRRFLFIDELQILTARSQYAAEFQDVLGSLIERGRKHKLNIITATQDPTGKNFPSSLQKSTRIFVAGKTVDDRYLSQYLHLPGASLLRGKGDLLLKNNEGLRNFKGFWLTPDAVQETLNTIVTRWGENTDRASVPACKPTAEVDPVTVDVTQYTPMPNGGKKDRQERRAATIAMIRQYQVEHGDWPTRHEIRKWHKKEFDLDLNDNTAKTILDAAQETEGDDNEA